MLLFALLAVILCALAYRTGFDDGFEKGSKNSCAFKVQSPKPNNPDFYKAR